MNNSAFYYVNGEPLKGKWIDLDYIDSIDDILEELANDGFISRDNDGNPDYGGDLLVADIEGVLAPHFYSNYGIFDLDGFNEAKDTDIDESVIAAFISIFGEWDKERCSDSYIGQYDCAESFAENYLEETGLLSEIPNSLVYYFDFEKYGRDMMMDGFCEDNDHYFHNW